MTAVSLKEKYNKEIAPALISEFGYKSVMQIPKITKICINRGVGEATVNNKIMDSFSDELAALSGQKSRISKSKKSIAAFKLRENLAIGCSVTLRGTRMYDFLNKFINIVLPKIRDFRGVKPNSFDGRGSYTLGIKEQIVFPEINYEKVVKLGGMDITIVTSAKTDKEAFFLLEKMGMPFRK